MNIQERRLEVGGLRIKSLTGGPSQRSSPDALPVVLVHGQGMSSRYMVPLAEALAALTEVHAPDQPGFGDSEKPQHDLGVNELADFLVAYMDAAGLVRAALFGNSLGCQIAVSCAVRHPDRVAKLVLQGPTTDPEARSMLRTVARWLLNGRREGSNPGFLLSEYRRAGFGRVLRTFRAMLDDRIEDKLPAVRAPALIVRGGQDPIVPQRWAETVAGLLPRGRLVVVPDAAHTLNHYAVEPLMAVMRPFLIEGTENRAEPGTAGSAGVRG
jgi:pimeloyl-ACP methyl ester carboxylesterase